MNTIFVNENKLYRITFILILLTIIQQFPVVSELFYNRIRLFLYISFSIISILSFLIFILRSYKIYHKFTLYFLLIVIYSFMLYIITIVSGRVTFNIFEMLVPFGIFITSIILNLDNKKTSYLVFAYLVFSLILGVSLIYYYGEGLTITKTYFFRSKNQVGPLIGISTVIAWLWLFDQKLINIKYNSIILRLILFVLLFLSIIILRNRSGMLGVSCVMFTYIVKNFNLRINKKNIIYILLFLVLLIVSIMSGFLKNIFNFIYNSIFLNYDISDINSISAGRIYGYQIAIDFIKKYPLLGRLNSIYESNTIPHNYILNTLVNYGLLSMPFILFYIYLWFFTLKNIIKGDNRHFSYIKWLLLFSLIVSLFEYTYPYGPGVSQIMLWFIIGQYFNEKNLRMFNP